MRGLFFKIFIIFWIAQSLIFVISTALIVSHRIPRPLFLLGPASAELRSESSQAAAVFESSGCSALQSFGQLRRYRVVDLIDAAGKSACNSGLNVQPETLTPNEITGRMMGSEYVWTVPVRSASGKQYLYLVTVPRDREHHWYEDLLHFSFPQLPVAIAVGGVTTFVLILIFTRPVARLRKAARELAHGNLSARVPEAQPRDASVSGDEFKALIHDFNHMAERLESLVDAHKLLLRDVSHELRSPLARLSVALELSREDADPAMTIHLDRMQREAERLNQLIGQLLTLSSMESIDKMASFERVSLKKLLEEMLPDAEYEAQQRDASLQLDTECDGMVQGKRELLYRAIENVVRNAIRYTAEGTEVKIRLFREGKSTNGTVVLEISDRGPGIPESELNSIFRPFYRVDAARSAHTGGFGVGLAIAERAVKLHNGTIRAINREAGGTTVEMQFPLAE